jgi:putative heme iron utilization protein
MTATNPKTRAARELLLRQSFGVLSTISVDVPGYPFGSITPYSVDDHNQPVIYTSHIAQHTRNMLQDPRVSLTVVESNTSSDDVQAQGRITCLADARPIQNAESGISERYFRHFPSARQYDQTHDFAFYRLELVRVRFIGGFGQIYWLTPEEFRTSNPFSAVEESQIVRHMNGDHSDALQRLCGSACTMTGIDAEGFDALVSGKKLRFPFEMPVHNMEEARHALIAAVKRH